VPASRFLKEWKGGFGSPEVWKCEIPFRSGGESHIGITKNWIQGILQGTPLLADGKEGINGVELSNAMMLSTWLNDWVDVPVDEDLFYGELQKRVASSKVKEGAGETLNVDGSFQV
jgi:hypothetical protein